MPRLHAGLCDHCRHQKVIGNTRGSTFSLCERSKTDDRFPKYPRLPVARCVGFERRDPSARDPSGRDPFARDPSARDPSGRD